MKRLVYACIVVAVAVFFTTCCFGEEQGGMMKKGWFGMGAKEYGSKMGDMHGMMMKKMMMEKQLVATQDGGVVILFGNKLIKYDKDMNLVKEVELKIDMEAMMKRMKECREMMKK